MAFGTYKPCHGCGSIGWKPVNTVCDECQGLLRAGKALMAKNVDKGFAFRLNGEWPPIYIPSTDTGVTARLGKAMSDVAREVLKPMKTTKDPHEPGTVEVPETGGRTYSNSNQRTASLWTGTKKAVKALNVLDTCVREAVRHAHKEGQTDGQNFLKQIASGEVSIQDLNEAHIEAGRR